MLMCMFADGIFLFVFLSSLSERENCLEGILGQVTPELKHCILWQHSLDVDH